MIRSMTGFASAKGGTGAFVWSWDLRSVNAKGLDLRLRVPDWLEGLEATLKPILAKAVTRGNITLSLRVAREEDNGALALNRAVLDTVLAALSDVQDAADARGLVLAPTSAGDVLALRGLLEPGGSDDDNAPVVARLKAEFVDLVASFVEMRRSEGAALAEILTDQLAQIAALTEQAAILAEARKDRVAETLKSNVARVLEAADGIDPDRLAQELALLAVKSDVTEEIDRLGAHVGAAQDLLVAGGAVGRKLDFLMQEFNREANTLCSKSQSSELTAVGLELKAVIDRMREQVQNIE